MNPIVLVIAILVLVATWVLALGIVLAIGYFIDKHLWSFWQRAGLFVPLSVVFATPVLGRISDFPFPSGLYMIFAITSWSTFESELRFVSFHTISAGIVVACLALVFARTFFEQRQGESRRA